MCFLFNLLLRLLIGTVRSMHILILLIPTDRPHLFSFFPFSLSRTPQSSKVHYIAPGGFRGLTRIRLFFFFFFFSKFILGA